jgi:hypothetical protein
MSQTLWALSYATAGSDERVYRPGGDPWTVIPGRTPDLHVAPPSTEVAQPIPDAPAVRHRPIWNAATTALPTAKLSGSTAVSC